MLVGLVCRADWATGRSRNYSIGMNQCLVIASTLLGDPPIVILDEPGNGLDPAGQREIRELIPLLAAQGRAVLLASHLLHEVEQICDRVAIVRKGELVETGSVRTILGRDSVVEITVADPTRAAAGLGSLEFVECTEAEGGGGVVHGDLGRGAGRKRGQADGGRGGRGGRQVDPARMA